MPPRRRWPSSRRQVEAIIGRVGGTLEKTDAWGRRKLAYDIGDHKEGFYVLHVIAGSGELMKEIDRRLRNTEGLLRHLIVRVDEHERKADRAKNIRVEDSRRRRVARGLPPDRQPGEGPQAAGWRRRRPRRFRSDGGIGIMAFAKKTGPAGKGRGRGAKAAGDKKDGQRRGMFRRRKVCKFCAERIDDINYKDVRMLSGFVPERGKVLPRRISGTCALHQRKLRTAIMRARQIALLPYVTE